MTLVAIALALQSQLVLFGVEAAQRAGLSASTMAMFTIGAAPILVATWAMRRSNSLLVWALLLFGWVPVALTPTPQLWAHWSREAATMKDEFNKCAWPHPPRSSAVSSRFDEHPRVIMIKGGEDLFAYVYETTGGIMHGTGYLFDPHRISTWSVSTRPPFFRPDSFEKKQQLDDDWWIVRY